MRRIRVAFLISELRGGGAERATADLASALDPSEFDVRLLLERDQPVLYEVADHILVDTLGVSGTRHTVRPLAERLSSFKPDVLYAALPHLNAVAAVSRLLVRPRPRLIVSVHNNHPLEFPHMEDGQLLRRLTPWTYRLADAIVAVSSGLRDQVANVPLVSSTKVRVIHNPIDIARVTSAAQLKSDHPWLTPDYRVVTTMGRLAYQKDYPTLLRAFALVHRRQPSARLIALGEGELRNELELLASSLGVHQYVEFLGLQRNPFSIVASSACFASTSLFEGFGMAIAEAMAAGAPVAATDCPYGPGEILQQGRCGLLAPPGDVDGVAANIARLLDDPVLRSALSTAGRLRAEDFRTSVIASQLTDLIRSLASGSARIDS